MRKFQGALQLAVVALLLLVAGAARADKFDDDLATARRVDSVEIPGLFWTVTADCAKQPDVVARRQCEAVRDVRAKEHLSRIFVTTGDSAAFTAGEWDATRKGVPITLRSCVACVKPFPAEGDRRFVVSRGEINGQKGSIVGPTLEKAFRRFPSETAAKRWLEKVVPRLRTEILFKLPAHNAAFDYSGAHVYYVDVEGYRVYDPCDGSIVMANPGSAPVNPDRTTCAPDEPSDTPAPVATPTTQPSASPPTRDPSLPFKLSTSMINQAMQRTRAQVNACYATYGVPGSANTEIEINADGTVAKVVLSGDFRGTPTGDCLVEAVRSTEFPKFQLGPMSIRYPFILK